MFSGVVPPGQRFGERSVEDLAEVPGLPDRHVLDQAEKVGSSRGQGASDVVLREPIGLPEDRLAHPSQIAVQVLFREIIEPG